MARKSGGSNKGSKIPGVALVELGPVSNDAKTSVALFEPFIVTCEIEGASPILFHRWSVESVEEKASAAKGSRAKKTDDTESYVYRNDDGMICLPGEYIRQSIIHAAKFRQDPRSPRKSLMDLAKASVFPMNQYYPIISAKTGKPVKEWDMLDRRRVVVQRNGITRSRPAFLAGWKVKAELRCDQPEYITPQMLNDLLALAGRVVGLADNRPSYGRFRVTHFEKLDI
jgi:hypothetical protein